MSLSPSQEIRRRLLHYAAGASLLPLLGMNLAQAQSAAAPSGLLADLFAANTQEAVLAKLQSSPVALQVTPSDYLLLDAPDIAPAGALGVRIMSEIPGTDLIMLFDKTPRAGMPSLLAALVIPGLTAPDVSLAIDFTGTTELSFLARAGGRVFSASREIKLATKERR